MTIRDVSLSKREGGQQSQDVGVRDQFKDVSERDQGPNQLSTEPNIPMILLSSCRVEEQARDRRGKRKGVFFVCDNTCLGRSAYAMHLD